MRIGRQAAAFRKLPADYPASILRDDALYELAVTLQQAGDPPAAAPPASRIDLSTGPLGPREKGFKDLGYYIAEGYEGLVHETRVELKVGMRYYFQPQMCMLQWRHSGLIN